jgi:type II secretory pathway component GspD/PulD (secretin)
MKFKFMILIYFLVVSSLVCAQGFIPLEGEKGDIVNEKLKNIKVTEKGNNLYSIELRNADLKDVIRYFAHEYKLNIIVNKDVSGKVTASLGNITIRQALEQVLDSQGYTIEEKDGILRVKKKATGAKEFRLRNISVDDIKKKISGLLSDTGKMVVEKTSNSILVVDKPDNLSMVEKYINMIDVEGKQVLIEAKFVETTLTNTQRLGIDWTIASTFKAGKRPTTFPFRKTGEKSFFPENDATSSDFSSNSGFPYAAKSDYVFGTLDFQQFQAVLDMLFSKTDTKLISNPRVATLNNQKATVSIATEYPLPKFEFNENTGAWNITDYEYKNFGITLDVTPIISNDNYKQRGLY